MRDWNYGIYFEPVEMMDLRTPIKEVILIYPYVCIWYEKEWEGFE